ncbi:MAG: FAD-dependent oxidoreductase [Kouleothrix sp.]
MPISTSASARHARGAAGGSGAGCRARATARLRSARFPATRRRHFSEHVLVDWAADEWARGGYSLVQPGRHGMRAQLARPAGALHFAGEATVPANNPATVHGALHAGASAPPPRCWASWRGSYHLGPRERTSRLARPGW